jgi:hypothetical protein
MASITTTAGQIRSEENSRVCDRCHIRPGVRMIDYFWACALCVRLYLDQLEVERWRR